MATKNRDRKIKLVRLQKGTCELFYGFTEEGNVINQFAQDPMFECVSTFCNCDWCGKGINSGWVIEEEGIVPFCFICDDHIILPENGEQNGRE